MNNRRKPIQGAVENGNKFIKQAFMLTIQGNRAYLHFYRSLVTIRRWYDQKKSIDET
jgi:hypothetical protein